MADAGPAFLPAHRQPDHRVRLEWGPTGATAVVGGDRPADVAVVVDLLSFTTTLGIAVERGTTVLPFRWRDERAEAYAAAQDAVLAVGRLEARSLPAGAAPVPTLSPAAMTRVAGVPRLVLPSPNGSTICAALAAGGATVAAASLRNADAVAAWLAPQVADGATVALVPAGERWPDGSLRPAAEDLWGAGAVLAGLPPGVLDDPTVASPEARVAVAAWRAVADRLPAELAACAGGRELADLGFADDVAVASEVGASRVVPLLVAGEFRPAPVM
ncbi:2-phosphosulfolactate phosphatase [Nocardioides sp. SOB77]|uniref:Probable 2-phosphosulfolactate phosphatase n=1 Tax=Nocardioides oceani TaxID=3058369 RepID=A0ABT8FBQ3_9ACTN|nr:2-phosphosulfolactate phosphatase [Nocardioides oceani]MDN4172117.1 2-phosphosulfolactate phosphatase [Nocardioides oceani]